MLNPFPAERLVDKLGRPYFLWDVDLTLDELRQRLHDPDMDVRSYWIGTTMRQARPDDAILLIGLPTMREMWPRVERYLGRTRAFWTWLLPRISDG